MRERERESLRLSLPQILDRKQQLPQLPPHPPLDARLQHHHHPRHQRAAVPLQRHRRRHHRPDLGQVERADLAHDVPEAHRHGGLHPGLRDHGHGRPPARRLHLRRRQLQRHEHHPRLGRHHVCADPREARRGAGHGQHEREYQPALVSCRWFPPPSPCPWRSMQASKQTKHLPRRKTLTYQLSLRSTSGLRTPPLATSSRWLPAPVSASSASCASGC